MYVVVNVYDRLHMTGGPMFSQLAQWHGHTKAIKIAAPAAKTRAGPPGEADFGVTHMFNLLMENNIVH